MIVIDAEAAIWTWAHLPAIYPSDLFVHLGLLHTQLAIIGEPQALFKIPQSWLGEEC
jgi:hypothetical protein